MKNFTLIFTLFAVLSLFSGHATAQCDSTAHYAQKYMTSNFISDGQSYRSLIYDDQVAEFYTTFYGGANYRIVSFSGLEKEQLIFSLYDQDDNLLFTNENHNNSPYWDFEFKSTISARIEARLDVAKQTSGCAVLLVGFER